jgi:thioredoxin reductase (NADPH)
MEQILTRYAIYIVPAVLGFVWYVWRQSRKHQSNINQLKTTIESGLTEPASLHPVIDPALCLGSGACVSACPEGDILGMIGRKAQLIHPTRCIGHGACAAACPHDAITLVFGTEKRGIDIPEVSPSFETNVPGMFIAGELGGMGLIGNAIEQGKQAMESICKKPRGKGAVKDVIIIGAGPSGISASLTAMKNKLNFITIEQDTMGGTVAQFPRGKLVMTRPVEMAMVGKVKFRETSKEKLMDFWLGVQRKTGLRIQSSERMEEVINEGKHFTVKTTKGTYQAKNLLLCIGRRGTPRKLGVPGEEQTKVVYRLVDPEQYRNQHVLVVGGGDAALEAATSIADEPGTTVTISYRSGSFNRAKEKNRQKIDRARDAGKLNVLLSSNVKKIGKDKVSIDQEGKIHTMKNDGVIVCAGGILPTPFLKKIGINVETKYGTA